MAESKSAMEVMKEAMEAAITEQSKKEVAVVKVAMDARMEAMAREIAALKCKGIASYRSNDMVANNSKWNIVELAPTLAAMGALSADQCTFRIGIEGVYRVMCSVCIGGERTSMGAGGWSALEINDVAKGYSNRDPHTVDTTMSFVSRLRVGDTIKVWISTQQNANGNQNWLQIEKL